MGIIGPLKKKKKNKKNQKIPRENGGAVRFQLSVLPRVLNVGFQTIPTPSPTKTIPGFGEGCDCFWHLDGEGLKYGDLTV